MQKKRYERSLRGALAEQEGWDDAKAKARLEEVHEHCKRQARVIAHPAGPSQSRDH